MADFNALTALINAYIKQNGVKAITGQILNGVLRGMVSALGKGYTVAGEASPTTDPGTMTGPVAYIAHTAGTYEHFGNLVVAQGEVAMLIYDEAVWRKDVLLSLSANATVDANVGTPEVTCTFVDGVLTFDFRNMKGNPGDAAGFGAVTATVDANVGTPGVSVQTSGPDTAKNITFAFRNLKGETGVTSCVVTVDNTTGTPSCAVSLVGQELHLDFSGLKGAQGNTGSSVDYPFEIVNNLTTNDATKALSAAMGVQLESEVSQLEAKVTDLEDFTDEISVDSPNYIEGKGINYNGLFDSPGAITTDFIPVTPGVKVVFTFGSSIVQGSNILAYGENKNYIDWYSPNAGTKNQNISSSVYYVRTSFVKANINDCSVKQGGVDIWEKTKKEPGTMVRTIEQSLTDAEKEQARTNIGALSADDVVEEIGASADDTLVDFGVFDESGNAIVTFEQGGIRTKNFDSRNIQVDTLVGDATPDLALSDEVGNAVMYLYRGHLFTKKFKSTDIASIKNSISELDGASDNLNTRVLNLEAQPPTDVDLLTNNIMTRCREEFAPIGHADVSYTPKRRIKILLIGNSVTQDHCGYLPWLFKQLYPDEVDFTIANFYSAGRTIKEYVEDFITGNQSGTYSHATNTATWTIESNVYLPDAITRESWDFISIQAYTHRDEYEDLSYAPTFVEWLRNNSPSSFELCYLMHQSFDGYWSPAQQKAVRDAATTIIKENPVSILFAPYFCIDEAEKYWNVYPTLTPDGTHLREGLPVMITGMHLMDVLCRRIGLLSKVINNGLMMTSAIQATLNVPGGNGTVDDTMNTNDNYMKAQYCAVAGTKKADAWLNKALNEMINGYN